MANLSENECKYSSSSSNCVITDTDNETSSDLSSSEFDYKVHFQRKEMDEENFNGDLPTTITLKNFPPCASQWKLCKLEALGIKYDTEALTVSKFMSNIKRTAIVKEKGFDENFPVIIQKLVDKTKDIFRFSFHFGDQLCTDLATKTREVTDLSKEFRASWSELKKELCGTAEEEFFVTAWCLNLIEFCTYIETLLRRRRLHQKEKRYTHLLMAFSKIFFMQPEGGGSYSEYFHIRKHQIHSEPDVRFITCPNRGEGEEKLLIVTKVKPYEALRGDFTAESFSFQNVANEVWAQHGIELFLERQGSFFYPGVLGLICIGTKVILTYLAIGTSHIEAVAKGKVDKNVYKASISYTRLYDYMDVSDRNEVLETFFWFGLVQSDSYFKYHTGD